MAADQKPIHQIIATHCTYGNNAISPRTGELEDRAMGYSARKASIPKTKLRMWYQTIEKFFNYSLPADTPAEAKGTLDATTAPKKFLFVPSTRGFQFVGSVFYRQEDTAGRPGSYFGHVLINKLERNAEPWSATDAMQLFDWDWAQEDSESLPELSALSTLPSASPKSVDDKLISLFVTSDRAADFENAPNGHLVPPRWREMTARSRQSRLRRVLRAAMESCMDKKRSALLVCEPELAILFFYAIGRLIPSSILADASFSTFETEYHKRLGVRITATSFAPETDCETAIDDAVLRRQFVVNTFGGTDSPEIANDESAFGPYVADVVDRLKDDGWAETDKILVAYSVSAPENARDLQSVFVAEQAVQCLLGTSRHPFPTRLDAKAQDYIGSRLRDFCVGGSCETVLAGIQKNPVDLQKFLELTCTQQNYEPCRDVVDSLIRELPKEVAEHLVAKPLSDSLSSEFIGKIVAWRFLENDLEKEKSFDSMSEMCDEVIKNASSPRRDSNSILVDAIGFLDQPETIFRKQFLDRVSISKRHGVLLALVDPQLAKMDLFAIQEKVFNWFDPKQQASFIKCIPDLNAASVDFRKFLIAEVSKQIDRKQIQTSMFYDHGNFKEKVQSFPNIASHLKQHIQDDLQLAKQVVDCFDKALVHSATPGALGLGPIPQLWATLKTIYLSDPGDVSKAVKNAEDVLVYLNGGEKPSLNKNLMIKWDQNLARSFDPPTQTSGFEVAPPTAPPKTRPSAGGRKASNTKDDAVDAPATVPSRVSTWAGGSKLARQEPIHNSMEDLPTTPRPTPSLQERKDTKARKAKQQLLMMIGGVFLFAGVVYLYSIDAKGQLAAHLNGEDDVKEDAAVLTDVDSSDSNNNEDDTQEPDSETDPETDPAAEIAALLAEGDWKAVLAKDPDNSKAKEMKAAAEKKTQIAAALAKGDWKAVLAIDPNNNKALEMKAAAEKKTQIAAALAKGDWKAVLALDPNNSKALEMKAAAEKKTQIAAALAKGDWKAVLALDPNNSKAKEMKVAAETKPTVIAPNWQDEDIWEKFPTEIVARKNDLGTLGGVFYIDFSVAKNKQPSPKIIPYQPGELRVGAGDWAVKIHPVIEKSFWEMTTNYEGKKYVIAYLRYIADEGILRFYRAPSGPFQGSDLADKNIGGISYKDLLAYSQLIQIHERTYISAGISTAFLFGKISSTQEKGQPVEKARHTGLPALKREVMNSIHHEIPLKFLNDCAIKGFITRPGTWNWRLDAICYRPNETAKWARFPVELFVEVKTPKNPDSHFDNYGLKLKQGVLTYQVTMPTATNANLRLTAQGNALVAIKKLKDLKVGLDATTKTKLGRENAQKINTTAKQAAEVQLANAKKLPNDKPDDKINKMIAVNNANAQIERIRKKNAVLPNQIKEDIGKIKNFEVQIANHLKTHPELVAIKDDVKKLNSYGNIPNLSQLYLKLCLEISQARKLPNGGSINVPFWHASPVQPIIDEQPKSPFN
jgi:hypothetical protein